MSRRMHKETFHVPLRASIFDESGADKRLYFVSFTALWCHLHLNDANLCLWLSTKLDHSNRHVFTIFPGIPCVHGE